MYYRNIENLNDRLYFFRRMRIAYKHRNKEQVLKIGDMILEKYPNDVEVLFLQAKTYRFLNDFDNVLKNLERIISSGEKLPNDFWSELYSTYYHLNRYEEALKLVPKLRHLKLMPDYFLSVSELIMTNALGKRANEETLRRHQYISSQILDYSDEKLYKHVTKHMVFEEKGKTTFNKNIDIDYLIEKVKENVAKTERTVSNEILDIYYFYVRNIGYAEQSDCNMIKVIVLPNTKKIINIYPVDHAECKDIPVLECNQDILFRTYKSKQLKPSNMVEKFNKRYSR